MTALPAARDAQQLLRLRSLRVERARERCRAAQLALDDAVAALHAQQRQVERSRRAIETLGHAIVHALAPQLPRWSTMAVAQRAALADRLERDEDTLIGAEQQLEQAQEALQRERAELTRALAREDAVRGLVHDTRRAHARACEQRAERELEDQGAPNRRGGR